MKVFFSIIMPTFNRKNCIKDAINSVLAQTYQNFELIIVDDGSTDETMKYIENTYRKEIDGGKIKCLQLLNNKGAAFARNEGLRSAKGNWIAYLDSDNRMRPNFLETFFENINLNPERKIFYAQIINEKSNIVIGRDFNFDDLIVENFIDLGVFVNSYEVYKELDGFDDKLKRLIDWDLIIRYTNKFKPKFIKKVLVDYYDGDEFARITNINSLEENYKHVIIKYLNNLTPVEFVKEYKKYFNKLCLVDGEILQKNNEIELMKSSKFWKLRERYMELKGLNMFYMKGLIKKALFVLKKEGLKMFLMYLYKYCIYGREYFKSNRSTDNDYNFWIKKNENIDPEIISGSIGNFIFSPKISIIVPVYNVDSKWLDACMQSVINQIYSNWELCIYDDASTKKETIDCLKKWEAADSRIRISYGKENLHISGASNEALKMATGEFVALLDNDDELSIDALYEIVKAINENPEIDFIYSDEDKIDINGKREEPFFKPDFSLDLLLSMNYITHLCIYRKSIVDKIGGFRQGYEGAQDYDMILRFIENTTPEKIKHISKILYHWRKIPQSTASDANIKNYAYVAAKKALSDYLDRNNIKGDVLDGEFVATYRIKRKIQTEPLVSIIIPFKDEADVLEKCVRSIFEKTDYENFEIILINNQSSKKETFEYLKSLKNKEKIEILDYNEPFNYSSINNFAVSKAKGDYILLLNNDTEIINKEWLSSMVEHILRDEVGIVGAKLLYPNNKIQHAGVVMGLGIASHAFKGLPAGRFGYFGMLNVIRNYSAVTAACLLIKKKIFQEVGGLNEKDLAVSFNDVDLCLKVKELGYNIVYTPYAELYHYESLSRGDDNQLEKTNPGKFKRVLAEREYMQKKWNKYIENDPCYNINLTRSAEDFSIRIRG